MPRSPVLFVTMFIC